MIAQVHFISSPNKTLCNVNTEGAAAALLATPQIVYKQRADVERLPFTVLLAPGSDCRFALVPQID